MSNEKDLENVQPAKGQSAEPEAQSTADTPVQTATEQPKRHYGILLLLIILAGSAAFVLLAPQPLTDQYLKPVTQWLSSIEKDLANSETAPEPAPTIRPASKPIPPAVKAELPPKPVPALTVKEANTASSEEVAAMLEAMQSLKEELKRLRIAQQNLESAQHDVQRMQLRTRLHWIINPANHLPQLAMAWEEVSLMPLLSDNEREQAREMRAMARKRLLDQQAWQQTMSSFADSLVVPKQANIIPSFSNGWLNWISEQFSIRPSLTDEQAENARLRQQLIETIHNIELEQWPDAKDWLQLRATLQLRLVALAADDAATGLQLPESFDGIKADLEQLRQTAKAWLEKTQ